MEISPPQRVFPPPPPVENDNLKRVLPSCTAATQIEIWSAARKRLSFVECAHDNDGTATADEVALHRQYLALVEARSVARTPYAAPTNSLLAFKMQQMGQDVGQQIQEMQQKMTEMHKQMHQSTHQEMQQIKQTQQEIREQLTMLRDLLLDEAPAIAAGFAARAASDAAGTANYSVDAAPDDEDA
jgi:hypothetical protein